MQQHLDSSYPRSKFLSHAEPLPLLHAHPLPANNNCRFVFMAVITHRIVMTFLCSVFFVSLHFISKNEIYIGAPRC